MTRLDNEASEALEKYDKERTNVENVIMSKKRKKNKRTSENYKRKNRKENYNQTKKEHEKEDNVRMNEITIKT